MMGLGGAYASSIHDQIESLFPNSLVGLSVIDLGTGKEVVRYNQDKLFVPASTVKVLTTLFALKKLGPHYQFSTKLYKYGDDIYLYFSGDPNLRLQDLVRLLHQLKKSNKCIKGNVYIVQRPWPFAPQADSWAIEDTKFCYGTAVRPFTLNENAYRFNYINQGIGQAPVTKDKTHPLGFQVVTEAITSFCPDGVLDDNCPLDREDTVYGTRIFGGVPHVLKELSLCLPLINKEAFAEGVVSTALHQCAISFSGRVLWADALPTGAQKIGESKSLPMIDLLGEMMPASNNLFADIIFLTAALDVDSGLKTWPRAAQKMATFLQENYHVNLESVRLLDGSGISRVALMTPGQMNQLMYSAHKDLRLYKLFKSTLTRPSERGTLRQRFLSFKDRLWVKTGSMTGIFNLTGYVQSKSGKIYAVTLFVNNFTNKSADQYSIIEIFLENIMSKVIKE